MTKTWDRLDMGPIGPLLELIDAAVREYQSVHPIDGSHPFLAQHPTRWNYDIWGTVLSTQGHQAPHIHRSGWLSGCYYARIPDAINADGDDQAGWIEFGRPQDHPTAKAKPVVRSCPLRGIYICESVLWYKGQQWRLVLCGVNFLFWLFFLCSPVVNKNKLWLKPLSGPSKAWW